MTLARPRVAITGIGMISGLGNDVKDSFARLMGGKSAITALTSEAHRCIRIPWASAVSEGALTEASSLRRDPSAFRSRSFLLAYAAALRAIRQSRLKSTELELCLGASTGSTREGVAECIGHTELTIHPLIARLTHEPIGALGHQLRSELSDEQVHVRNSTVVSSACSSGALAIAIGAMRLEQGAAWPQLVGGVDSLNLLTLCGFEALGAMASEACRPFDEERSGLSLGEGAGFLVLESHAMVQRRGARVLAWLDSYAIGSEAHHLTHPEVDGARATALIRTAIERASVDPSELGYINAHGTATLANDAMESRALRAAIGPAIDDILVSSSKGQVGHTLAAAGAIEAVITAQALIEQAVPPTVGLKRPAEDCRLKHVFERGVRTPLVAALSTSFGFGGAGAVLVMRGADSNPNPAEPQRQARAVVESTWEAEPLHVSGVVTLGPAGIRRGSQNAAWLDEFDRDERIEIPFEPLDRLVMERSRRFDRMTALTALGCSVALEEAGYRASTSGSHESGDPIGSPAIDHAALHDGLIGMVAGNACGAVGRTAAFIDRILKRGARAANPAEFPHLLPSSVSGNASIYAGLRGPCFSVSDVGATMQSALELSITCVRSGMAKAMLAGTTEVRDSAVEQTMEPSGRNDGNDGSAWLVIEGSNSANAHGRGQCRLMATGWVGDWGDTHLPYAAGRDTDWVLWEGDPLGADEWLQRLGWKHHKRIIVPSRRFDGWTRPGFLLAASVGLVLSGKASGVLVVTDCPKGRHVSRFTAVA